MDERRLFEGGHLASSNRPAIKGSEQPATSGDSHQTAAPAGNQQQLALIEALAQKLLEEALGEALEWHLRRQLHATADETVRAAFAAATGGGGERRFEEEDERDLEEASELESERARRADLLASQADDEDDGEDEDEDEDTLNAGNWRAPSPAAEAERLARGGTADLFGELAEMSRCAERIDSILEQSASEHSTRSGSALRMRSVSPFAPPLRYDDAEDADEDAVLEEADYDMERTGGADDELD